MLPHCALNVKQVAYISRNNERWSDQWFSLPRRLASRVLNIISSDSSVNNEMFAECLPGDQYAHLMRPQALNTPFEEHVFSIIQRQAALLDIEIVDTLLPRMLSRVDYSISSPPPLPEDNKQQQHSDDALVVEHHHHSSRDTVLKCHRFMWYVSVEDCKKMVLGSDQYSLSSDLGGSSSATTMTTTTTTSSSSTSPGSTVFDGTSMGISPPNLPEIEVFDYNVKDEVVEEEGVSESHMYEKKQYEDNDGYDDDSFMLSLFHDNFLINNVVNIKRELDLKWKAEEA
jgi:hypothetical protein